MYRPRDHRIVAGVAAGLARHLGVPVLAVRIALVVLLGFNALGLLLYAAYWAVLPQEARGDEQPAGRDLSALAPFAAIGLGVVLLQALVFDDQVATTVGWMIAVIAVGAGVIWHQSDSSRREQGADYNIASTPWVAAIVSENDRRSFLFRFIGGGVLVAIGLIGVVAVYAPDNSISAVFNGVIFAFVGLAGVGVVVAPLLWRTFGQLRAEREGRIREQERAELAAMIHDQVLHTLALIQRNSADIKEVQRLARGQERSLRNWLYKPTASPTERFAAALEQAAAEVEDTYAITVETVVVGDTQCDDRVAALVAAAREALVNAARHAGVQTVSLYAEVEEDELSVFVRDRGAGFEIDGVAETRHGVRGSIIGRMQRHGGRAEIRSAPGDGTEVRLMLPVTRESVTAGKEQAR
ncbi:putative two-component system sensor kinase [Actinoplanes missouriensis 431]|uniref:Putative two-component system sensor kinase n=1 Tax=Actinoplanes missouriensis (strain ATCC 14538 / DSM 43046 / CBS 188.64 / JCM 3121 / NBRC 102363 / NCIMB 12654 / NRRL B-3342 / UNCC 431) TaxID=512565 RepID=I0GYT6_ACTM4|nr:ATP-binding protein [Actinoplanes missouriensis]BAL85923.1 putative two-component system sensor kinase [Actinoplanes missouriensis 431]